MRIRQPISSSIRTAIVSLLLMLVATPASAQKFFTLEKDSIPVFRGFALSFDLVGAGMAMFSDYGQYEGTLRLNLHDEWFPLVEIGLGRADAEDEVTKNRYTTKAPYFKVGVDKNLLKEKHGPYRLLVGLRYAYTSYKANIIRPGLVDPYWQYEAIYDVKDAPCKMHWAEVAVGLDAKIWGPLHLGWSVRYKLRIAHKEEGDFGKVWYVPGFGVNSNGRIDATFNATIDI